MKDIFRNLFVLLAVALVMNYGLALLSSESDFLTHAEIAEMSAFSGDDEATDHHGSDSHDNDYHCGVVSCTAPFLTLPKIQNRDLFQRFMAFVPMPAGSAMRSACVIKDPPIPRYTA